MSVETWMDPNILISLKELLGDLKMHLYWKILKKKPLLWGEFFYYARPRGTEGFENWHYHVHTEKWRIMKLLKKYSFRIIKRDLNEGYIYLLCMR